MLRGPGAELTLTANTQPAVLTASVAAAAALAAAGVRPTSPRATAWASTPPWSGGRAPFADAVRLVRKRGEFMQEAVPVGTGAMAALLGVDPAVVDEVCAEVAQGEVVGVANMNAPGQIVIAGHRAAVERAVKAAATRGGKSGMLPVSAPFHSALMKPAADRLAAELAAMSAETPRIPVVRNVDAGLPTRAEEVKPFLLRQVASPVRWSACVARLDRAGAREFVEVGPGRVLSGLLKRIIDGAAGHSVEDPASLRQDRRRALRPERAGERRRRLSPAASPSSPAAAAASVSRSLARWQRPGLPW